MITDLVRLSPASVAASAVLTLHYRSLSLMAATASAPLGSTLSLPKDFSNLRIEALEKAC